MEAYETYSTVLIVLTVALLLIAAGVGKKQLVWKRPRPLPVRSRRHTPVTVRPHRRCGQQAGGRRRRSQAAPATRCQRLVRRPVSTAAAAMWSAMTGSDAASNLNRAPPLATSAT